MALSDEEYAAVIAPFMADKYGIPDLTDEDAYRLAMAEAKAIRARVALARLDRAP